MGVEIPHGKGQFCGIVWPIKKYCESLTLCMQQNTNSGISTITAADGTAASGCSAPDWLESHHVVLRKKFAPAMRPFVEILWPLVRSDIYIDCQATVVSFCGIE